jgi:hypothetical protein
MFALKPIGRSCDGCTMCCQGWLTGEAWGHKFYPGRPCGWITKKGCAIYENRPINPCQTFQCEWKRNVSLPQWLKPDVSGVIVKYSVLDQHVYLRVVESRQDIDPRIYDWAQQHCDQHNQSVVVPASNAVRVYTTDPNFRTRISEIFRVVD